MDISELRKRINDLKHALSNEENMRQRCEQMFPGITVNIEINGSNLKITGLTEEQMAQLMTP